MDYSLTHRSGIQVLAVVMLVAPIGCGRLSPKKIERELEALGKYATTLERESMAAEKFIAAIENGPRDLTAVGRVECKLPFIDSKTTVVCEQGDYVAIHTTTAIERCSIAKLSARELTSSLSNPFHVSVIGTVSPKLAAKMNEAGVRVFSRYTDQMQMAIKLDIVEATQQPVNIIVIGSKNLNKAKVMFGGQNLDSVSRAMKEAEGVGKLVETQPQMINELKAIQSTGVGEERTALLVFHNEGGLITFSDKETMTLEQLAKLPGDVLPLSCETYAVEGLAVGTTTKLDLELTIRALTKAKQLHGPQRVLHTEFLGSFAEA